MTAPFDPSLHISFDWKSNGGSFLPLLQYDYDYDCLHDEAFELLVDDLRNFMPEDCLGALARHVAPAGLEVWLIDFFEDNYHVALVPTAQVGAFSAYWLDGERDDEAVDGHGDDDDGNDGDDGEDDEDDGYGDIEPELRRVEPAAAPLNEPGAPRLALIVDSASFASSPELDIDRSIARVWSPYEEDEDDGGYIDFSVWPPRKLDLPTAASDRPFFRAWEPVFQSRHRNIWSHAPAPDRKSGMREQVGLQLAQIDDMASWNPAWLGAGVRLQDRHAVAKWCHDGMVVVASSVDHKGKDISQLLSVTDSDAQVWYETRRRLNVFPFADAPRCLVVEDDTRIALADGVITADDFLRLPKPLHDEASGLIALHDDTVVYFTETKTAVRMHMLDCATMDHSSVLLSGFGFTGVDNGERYAGFGNIDVRKGHGDWWILNHRSNRFGEVDIALLWNARSDETIRIRQQDIRLEQPLIVYLRSLGRYLAVAGSTVALLMEFDALYAAKEKRVLEWVPA